MSDLAIFQTPAPAAQMREIQFSRFNGLMDNQPKMFSEPLDSFMAIFDQHQPLLDKRAGKTWSPTIYAEGSTRKSANVQAITALVVDVDDGTPFQALAEKLAPFRYVVHTSHSHTEAHPKYRLVLPLASPVPVSEWPPVWLRLNEFVGGHADPAAKDPARFYFLPSKRPEATGHFAKQIYGRLITLDDLPPVAVPAVTTSKAKTAKGQGTASNYDEVDDPSQYEDEAPGLEQVVKHCRFIREASSPANQPHVAEPHWMAMLSNVCRFQGGRDFAHQASCHDERYTPEETDERLRRHRVESSPITCARIQALGYTHCPSGGCPLPDGRSTAAPAGLGTWPQRFDHKTIAHPVILQSFLDNVFPDGLTYAHGEYHRYLHGAYDRLDGMSEVQQPLMLFLGQSATSTFVKQLEDLLRTQQAQKAGKFVPALSYLCLRNGTLNLETGELEEHSPRHQLRTRLDVIWDPDAKCPKFLVYLSSSFEPDDDTEQKTDFVQEWLGYMLVPDASFQKMLWLVGSGANGKSVLLAIIQHLVGAENISNAMMDTFHLPYVRAELDGKLGNIAGEIAAEAMLNDAYMKAIVAGDEIEASRKYKPSFSFRPFVRLMAATNNLPRTKDLSHGFFRRMIFLLFNRRFAEHEQNPRLITELLEELPGILAWAVQGLHRLRRQGGFTVPPSSTAALEQYRLEADPVQLFAGDCLEASTSVRISTRDLMALQEAWCRDYKFQVRSAVTVGHIFRELGFTPIKSNGTRYWKVALTPAGRELAQRLGLAIMENRTSHGAANDAYSQNAVSPLAVKYRV